VKPSIISVADAAHECGLTSRKLTEWAGLGLVPGATHDRPRAKWTIDRAKFFAGLDVLKATVAEKGRSLGAEMQKPLPGLTKAYKTVMSEGWIRDTLIPALDAANADRHPATGIPVAPEVPALEPPRGVVVTMTDRATIRTVQEHIDAQANRIPWWAEWWLMPVGMAIGALAGYIVYGR
jgi:hypothetical protein